MSRQKTSIILKIAVLLLMACLIPAVGITYGRYQSTIAAKTWNVTSVSANTIGVYGGAYDAPSADNPWQELSKGWTQCDGSATLDFFVANGTWEDDFASRDQTFNISLIAGLSADNVKVSLTYTDVSGAHHTASGKREEIVKGSALYASYGEGWIIKFFETDGTELSLSLAGGELSHQDLTLSVSGTGDPSLLHLQVTGEYADQ